MQKTKRSFMAKVPGHLYEVPIYEVLPGVGIAETGETMPIVFVRGSKVTEENTTGPLAGTLHEHLVTVMIEDLRLKSSEIPSRETSLVITKLEEARHWMEEREKAREAQGVLGTYQPHKNGN